MRTSGVVKYSDAPASVQTGTFSAPAIVRVLQRGELGAVYNIGGAAEFTVRDIGSMLAAKFGLAGDVELHSVRVRDRCAPCCWVPSRQQNKD